MDAVPLNQSWWVVPDKLLAGGYPGAPEASKAREKLSRLLDAGVRAVLCLQPPDERGGGGQPFVPYEPMLEHLARDRGHRVDLHRFPIRDGNVPTPERMAEILDTIDQAIDSGCPVYVHCWGGHGRTGTVVGCWLVRHGMDGQQALHHIAELRRGHPELRHRPSPEMSAQEDMVRAWPRGAAPASGVACDPPGLADRTRGALLGLAAGDALGTTLEFEHPGTFEPIDDMIGGGPFHLKPGEWTDDTSMALCLAASLVEKQGFDPLDQMHRYCRWWREGYLSSTGRCFDIGNTVSSALATFERTGDPWAGPTHPRSAGNGSLMRLAPVPLAFATNPAQAIQMAGDSSRTTHGAAEAVDGCRYFAGLVVGALQGKPKDCLLADHYTPVPGLWDEQPLSPKVAEVAAGSFKIKQPPAIRGTGYVVDCLEAALWAFHSAESFREGALLAVNLGNDADTTSAVYGQLAGAFFGASGIPPEWRQRVAQRELIEQLADQLLALANSLGQ